MNKFRPQDLPKSYILKRRLKPWYSDVYNWQSRAKWCPAGWKLNKQVIGNQFGRLHYLACHAPAPIQKCWTKAYKTFYKKHFGVHNGSSVRYFNNYSCHSWL